MVDVGGGVVLQDQWRIGAMAQLITPSTVDELSGPRRFGSVDIGITLGTRIPRVGTMFAIQGGPGWRLFEENGAVFEAVAVPWFGAELGWDIQPRDRRGERWPIIIEPVAGVRFDARRVDLAVQGSASDPVPLPQWSVTFALRMVVEPTPIKRARVADDSLGSGPLAFGQDSTRSEVIVPARSGH